MQTYSVLIFLKGKKIGNKFGMARECSASAETEEEFFAGIEAEFPDASIQRDTLVIVS